MKATLRLLTAVVVFIGATLAMANPAAAVPTVGFTVSSVGLTAGEPAIYTADAVCDLAPCRYQWRWYRVLGNDRLGTTMGEGTELAFAFSTPGLKRVVLKVTNATRTHGFAVASLVVRVLPGEVGPPAEPDPTEPVDPPAEPDPTEPDPTEPVDPPVDPPADPPAEETPPVEEPALPPVDETPPVDTPTTPSAEEPPTDIPTATDPGPATSTDPAAPPAESSCPAVTAPAPIEREPLQATDLPATDPIEPTCPAPPEPAPDTSSASPSTAAPAADPPPVENPPLAATSVDPVDEPIPAS